MNRKVIIGILAAGTMLPGLAAWKGFASENYVCGPKLTAEALNGKVVLVDKWATWCGPCRAMMPHTEKIAKKYKSRGLIVVGSHASRGFSKDGIAKYVKENKFSFSFYKEANWDGDVGYDGGIPFLYVIDKSGKVVYGGRNPEAVEKAVESALGKAGGNTIFDDAELVEYKSLKGKLTIEEYKTTLVKTIESEIAEGKKAEAVKHIDLLTATWPSLKKDWFAKRKELLKK